jgi:hypothetical protein
MNTALEILRSIAGLFVEDELLVVGILGIVGLTALLMHQADAHPLLAGSVLVCGILLVLAASVVVTARRTRA